MIIGAHEEIIGVKEQSVISSDDFVYFKIDTPIQIKESFRAIDILFDRFSQAP